VDRAPPKLPNTTSRLIAMAASLGVGVEAIRQEMGCSASAFLEYVQGKKEPPWPEFDRLIQFIVREQGKMIVKNRELLSEIRVRRDKT
jgi:hypothetical protein